MRQKLTDKRLWLLLACLVGTTLLLNLPDLAAAEHDINTVVATPTPSPFLEQDSTFTTTSDSSLDLNGFWRTLAEIASVMLLAALLGGMVAYRRRLTVFEHNLFHAHILLSVAGALMMLIVGNQLVRAFGLLGAASVVRYRYSLRNPRDASKLIIALGIGMATGVGLYVLAVCAAAVVFIFSRGLDFFTTRSNHIVVVTRPVALRIRTTQPDAVMARVEEVFAQRGTKPRLRRYRRARKKNLDGAPIFRLDYSVRLRPDDGQSQLTSEITDDSILLVRWKTEKPKKV